VPRADFRFAFAKRVRYAEIDAQAVLFNPRYLEYFDIGLVEYWRAAGIYEKTSMNGGAEFHIARAQVDFRVPILLDEEIDICVRCSRIGTASMTLLFELHGAGKDDLRATGEEVHVHVAEARGRSAAIPRWAVDCFERYEGRALQARQDTGK